MFREIYQATSRYLAFKKLTKIIVAWKLVYLAFRKLQTSSSNSAGRLAKE